MPRKTIPHPPLGPLTIHWTTTDHGPCIVRLQLHSATRTTTPPDSGSCPEIDRFADDLVQQLAGEPVELSLDLVDLTRCPPFQARVLQAIQRIPRGTVSTYREIAERLGQPAASRAVGNALAQNPFPLVLPCHRVIRSDGRLGGYRGGRLMKRKLLEQEGVRFGQSDTVIGSGAIP